MSEQEPDSKEAVSAPTAPAKTFDAWTATLEEGLVHFAGETEISAEHMRWVMAREITSRQNQISNGTGRDVLDAVADCVRAGLVLPSWLSKLFLDRYHAVSLHRRVDSWDDNEAFGPTHPEAESLRPSPSKLRMIRMKAQWGAILRAYFELKDVPRTEEGYEQAAAHFKWKLSPKQVKSLLPKTRTNRRGAQPTPSELTDAVPNWVDPLGIGEKSTKRDE